VVGEPIMGVNPIEGTYVFEAGTALDDGILKSAGGRVLAVTGLGSDLTDARDKAYRVISGITLHGSHYRSDIALNASIAEKGN
jgi:phosphoribosylamine--glycine ligase